MVNMEEYTPKNIIDEMELVSIRLSDDTPLRVYDMQDRKPGDKPMPINKEKAWHGSKRD